MVFQHLCEMHNHKIKWKIGYQKIIDVLFTIDNKNKNKDLLYTLTLHALWDVMV